jgi:ammonia channel protein AmtB
MTESSLVLTNNQLQTALDNLWINLALFGVFFMTTGVVFLEAGFIRK